MSNIPGIQNHLSVVRCKDAADAVSKGYNYMRPEFLPAKIDKVVVVENGTQSGNSTVDIIFEDEAGQKHVCMLTGHLIQSLAGVTV